MRKRKAKFRSSRLLKKKRRKIAFRVVFYSILLTGLVYTLSYLSFTEILSIEKIEIVGNQVLEERDLRTLVEAELEGKVLGLFSKKNIFLYPKGLIRTKLVNQSGRISSVDVSLKGFKVLQIKVTERKAVAMWCQLEELSKLEWLEELGESEEQNDLPQDCYFVDATGFIFTSTSSFSDASLLRYQGEVSGATPIGSYFWRRADAEKVANFLNLLKSLEVKAVKISKEPEGRVIVTLNTDTDLILNLNDNWPRAFENLVALISEPEFREYGSDNLLSPFTYIDLRFNNKLLYKLK